MSMYFDFKVNLKPGVVLACIEWHPKLSLLAVGSCLAESPVRTYVNIFNHMGELIADVNELCLENNESTAVSWHPIKKILAVGFRSGDIQLWNDQPDFIDIPSPHSSPIKIFKWSPLGTRFVSIDQNGEVTAWKTEDRNTIVRLFRDRVEGTPTYLEFCCSKPGLDVKSLAKQAVAGDEKALDIFSGWRPKTGTAQPTFSRDNSCCFVAVSPNKLYYISEAGNVKNVANFEFPIIRILHHLKKNLLVVILNKGWVRWYSVDVDGQLQDINKVRLDDADFDKSFVWAGDDLLVCITSRSKYALRFLDVNTSNTFVVHGYVENNEARTFTAISYLDAKGTLCAGSSDGRVTMWKKRNSAESAEDWIEISTCKMKNRIVYCTWGVQHVAIATEEALFVLQEHELCWSYNKKVCVVQRTANEVMITHKGHSIKLNTDLKIVGISASEEHIAVWSGKTVAVYKLMIDSTAFNVLGTFNIECESILVFEQSLVILPITLFQHGKLLITTFQGATKQNLDSDGQPIAMHLNQNYLVTATVIGMIHVWDLSRREAKAYVHPKDLCESITDFGEVVMIRINSTGMRVSLTIANSNLIPLPYIFVWEVETDTIIHHQFEDSNVDRRYITAHYWDSKEPCLLACETRTCDDDEKSNEKDIREIRDDIILPSKKWTREIRKVKLVMLFISKENGIIVQDEVPMSSDYLNLLGIDIPHFIILKKSTCDMFASMERLLLNYFDEASVNNESIKNAIIKFSFSLSVGNLDDAYKSISSINNTDVWNNLSKMCIRKKRLDVAQICLGNTTDARGISLLRNLVRESQLEVKLAALAIHMEMLDEAEMLYKSVERHDLLNKMYQKANHWDKALQIAETKDRIHLRNTYDAFGRYLERQRDVEGAIKMFELANTHRKNVPRLLLQNPVALEKYIQKSKDPILLKWWAQYVESTRNMELAMKYYEQAEDYFSTVRILCFLENSEQAALVATSSNDSAACYHLARHYENMGQIEKAVNFFIKSNVYANAIRICKENGLDDQLWHISSLGGGREKLEIARYFESVDPYKSVTLYHKAQNYHKALSLACKYDLHDSVEIISTELNSKTDSELMEKCAEYFMMKGMFESTIKLLTSAKKFEEAIEICTKQRVLLTDDIADLLVPPVDHPNRINIMNKLGDYSFFLGNYHLSAQMFTQAGNKVKAMKALLKSGDTEKIIFFANVSREKEIYIMAANYLQSLDWHLQADLLKHIINFYTKAKASHLLANFYIACAQIEIDEYRNYDKSIGALNEASRCLSKDPDQYGQALEYIVKRTSIVKKFLEIKRQFEKGENETAMSQARQFLNSDLDLVRRGDVYSLMIENSAENDDWDSAAQLATEMKKYLPNDNLSFYIHKGVLERLGIENNDSNTTSIDKRPTTSALDEIEDIT